MRSFLFTAIILSLFSHKVYSQLVNTPNDPFLSPGIQLDTTASPYPFGIILKSDAVIYGKCKNTSNSRNVTSYEYDIRDNFPYNIRVYFENFQLEYENVFFGKTLSFVYRTTGRDEYFGLEFGKLFLNSSIAFTDSIDQLADKSYWFIGANFLSGYSDAISLSYSINANYGLLPGGFDRNRYYSFEFGCGIRIPFSFCAAYLMAGYENSEFKNEREVNEEYSVLYYNTDTFKITIMLSLGFDL